MFWTAYVLLCWPIPICSNFLSLESSSFIIIFRALIFLHFFPIFFHLLLFLLPCIYSIFLPFLVCYYLKTSRCFILSMTVSFILLCSFIASFFSWCSLQLNAPIRVDIFEHTEWVSCFERLHGEFFNFLWSKLSIFSPLF